MSFGGQDRVNSSLGTQFKTVPQQKYCPRSCTCV